MTPQDAAVQATDLRRWALEVLTPADLQALADAGLSIVQTSRLTATADAFLQSYTAPLEAENADLRAQLAKACEDVVTLRDWRTRAVGPLHAVQSWLVMINEQDALGGNPLVDELAELGWLLAEATDAE